MTEQNKKRIRAAVMLLLALGLADAAYNNGMQLSWFHHGSPEIHGSGFPESASKQADAATATAAGGSNEGATLPTLAMLPTAKPRSADGGGHGHGDFTQVASAGNDDPNDILSGTGSLDGISPSAGVAGTPASPSGDDTELFTSGSPGAGNADTGTGSGSGSGAGTGSSGSPEGPVLGVPSTGGSTGGGSTGGGSTGGSTGGNGSDGGTATNPIDPGNPIGGGTTSPVPEPSTLALMALGAVAILARRKRRTN